MPNNKVIIESKPQMKFVTPSRSVRNLIVVTPTYNDSSVTYNSSTTLYSVEPIEDGFYPLNSRIVSL